MLIKATRAPKKYRTRLNWHQHINDLMEEGENEFILQYRMPLETFEQLHNLLQGQLYQETDDPNVEAISSHIMLHCLLRWLAGGKCADIRIVAGISRASFYRVLHITMNAIVNNNELRIVPPTTLEDIDKAAYDFSQRSTHTAITGCVAALDGWLVETIAPTKSPTVTTKPFYSGHYSRFGMNVQLAVNSKCEFVFVSVAAPGGTNDVAAYRKIAYAKYIEQLPPGRYVVADNAYICTEHLLTPYSGSNTSYRNFDTFNFYLSQLRTTVERSIGILVQRWQIFKAPMNANLPTVSKAVICATRLHNFIIKNQPYDSMRQIAMASSIVEMDIMNSIHFTGAEISVRGNSLMRQLIVDHLQNNSLTRPQYNVVRNPWQTNNTQI
jgi:hypothetical protein